MKHLLIIITLLLVSCSDNEIPTKEINYVYSCDDCTVYYSTGEKGKMYNVKIGGQFTRRVILDTNQIPQLSIINHNGQAYGKIVHLSSKQEIEEYLYDEGSINLVLK